MTETPPPSIPPSIPPRKRPTSGAGTRTVTTVHGRGDDDGAARPAEAVLHTPTAHTPTTRAVPPPPPPPTSSSTPPPPPPAPADAAAPGEVEAEGPSPLEVAVDRTGTWLKQAASATGSSVSSAYASLTRPRPKEAPMTAQPEAPTAPPRPSQSAAGAPATGPTARPATGTIRAVGSGPRRVRLAVSRVDPWSVMKLAFLLSFAAGIVLVVAVSVVWLTLDGLHVFTSVNNLVLQIVGDESGSKINVLDYVKFNKVLSAATLVAVIDVFLLTALATIGAFLYNVVAALVGGVHVTMTDE